VTHPDIRAALRRERLNTLLADAEAARKAWPARLHRRQAATAARRGSPLLRRAGTGTRVVLRDEAAVVIRPVRSSDALLLADGFARLSAEYQISLSPGPAELGAGPSAAAAPVAWAHRAAGPA
jgi:hypothetical protein